MEEGHKETRFIGRRKTLLSLAKLTFLASDGSDDSSTPAPPRSNSDWSMMDSISTNQCGLTTLQDRSPVTDARTATSTEKTLSDINLLLEWVNLQVGGLTVSNAFVCSAILQL